MCPWSVLDPLGHSPASGVVMSYPITRNPSGAYCRAHVCVKVEAGSNLTLDHSHSHPADILVPKRSVGKPTTIDLFVISPLHSSFVGSRAHSRCGHQGGGRGNMRGMTQSAGVYRCLYGCRNIWDVEAM